MKEKEQKILSRYDKASLSETYYDLAIIGGGVTGAGIALDAASRGLKTILLEKNDFASGTSSKSTKLVHGGLRYLKQLEFNLVRLTGTERAVLHRLARHLVKPEKMLLPLVKNGTYGKLGASLGLWVYDILAGVDSEGRHKMLNKADTLATEPLLDEKGLTGGGIYGEYQTDDARLTIELIKTAMRHGADCINYMEVEDFKTDKGKITGIHVKDLIENSELTINADCVVSAAGPWVDELRKKNKSLNNKTLHLTKGVHLVVDHAKFPLKQSIYFDVPDGRMIFAIPRGKITYIGTTDTDYKGDLNHIDVDLEDATYLIESVNAIFNQLNLSIDDVESTWVGLRPLIAEKGKTASEISRKDEIFQADNGLISIAGGKLTGYRKMAEKIVDLVVYKSNGVHKNEKCRTKNIHLTINPIATDEELKKYTSILQRHLSHIDCSEYLAKYLVFNYGKESDKILGYYHATDESGHSEAERLIMAELKYGIEHEMVTNSTDFFIRRTGRLYFDIHSVKEHKDMVNQELSKYFSWSEQEQMADLNKINLALEHVVSFKNTAQ